MAVTGKPAKAGQTDAQLLAFIDKGGSVASPKAAPAAPTAPTGTAQHPLKFPERDLFDRLERARASGAVKLPRNTWILQAIAEKLGRDGF